MEVFLTNRSTLQGVRHMPTAELLAPPAAHFGLLLAEAHETLDAAQRRQNCIIGVIAAHYTQREDGDQSRLTAVGERIRAAGDDVADYVSAVTRFTAWPPRLQTVSLPAHTVAAGRTSDAFGERG
jgi:hypothetical protein